MIIVSIHLYSFDWKQIKPNLISSFKDVGEFYKLVGRESEEGKKRVRKGRRESEKEKERERGREGERVKKRRRERGREGECEKETDRE